MIDSQADATIISAAILGVLVLALILGVLFRNWVRRFYIRTAEILLLFVCIVFVFWLAIAGAVAAQSYGTTLGWSGPLWGIGFALGAFAGFIVSAIFAATFFLLVEIAENTRKMALSFDRSNNRTLWDDGDYN